MAAAGQEGVGILEQETRIITERNFRELATVEGNIVTASRGREIHTLMVTSCVPGDGKTTSAIGIAVTMAKMPHSKVLLVDGNLHGPKIHERFGLPRSPGLSDYVLSTGESAALAGQVIRNTEFENLQVLTSGTAVDNSLKVFRSPQFHDRLSWLKETFTHIVFDTAFYLGPSDASLVAKWFDGILLVVACERTKKPVIQLVRDRIAGADGNLIGVIMNRRRYYIPSWAYRFI